jgi:hypothetical protein
MAGDPAGTVTHEITPERRGQQIAEAGCDRKVPLVHRV